MGAEMPLPGQDTDDAFGVGSLARGGVPEPRVAMSANKPGQRPEGQEASSLANALRDCLVSGVIIIDEHQRIASLTGEAAQILGLKAGAAPHRPLGDLPAPLQEMVRETVSSGKPIAGRLVELTVEGREPVSIRASAAPVGPGKTDAGRTLLLIDQTSGRRLDQSLRQLDRLATMGTLSASIAHEIKNALVAGKTFFDLLLEKNQDAELAGIVRREVGRIDSLVSRMLKFAGPDHLAFATLHLHEVLEHSLRLIQPQRKIKAIGLARSFLAAPDLVNGDGHQLEQAFVNLLLNALEAMGQDGTLTVTTETTRPQSTPTQPREAEGPRLLVTIKDTGAGISQQNMERLFEPFFTTKPEGTGLGLAITQRIIHEHRGVITVASQPGQGTTFQISLPALERE